MGRNLEDSVTWVDSSKIKRNIMKYSDKVWRRKSLLMFSLMILICCEVERQLLLSHRHHKIERMGNMDRLSWSLAEVNISIPELARSPRQGLR